MISRRIFFMMLALSLFLCLATAVLWVRSYYVNDRLRFSHLTLKQHGYTFEGLYADSTEGGLRIVVRWDRQFPDPQTKEEKLRSGMERENARAPILSHVRPQKLPATIIGFAASRDRYHKDGFHHHSVSLTVPFWFDAAVGIAVSLACLAHNLRRRRITPGGCACCGYNLTGNTSGVCPECGVDVGSHAVPPASDTA